MSPDKSEGVPDLMQVALDNPNVPKIYLNGFQIGTTNADITFLAQQNGRPAAILNMSFEIGKTLVAKLGPVVDRIEKASGTSFNTTDDLDKVFASMRDDKSE